MNIDKATYEKYAQGRARKSPLVKDCCNAFLVGGGICALAQLLKDLYRMAGAEEKTAGMLVSSTLILVAAVLTGFGVFDKIAAFAGAGTLVPITGFANSVVAPAIDARTEGFILGVGANMFQIAGPVVVSGTVAGALYGTLYWLFTLT